MDTGTDSAYRLAGPRTEADWAEYRAIRRAADFDGDDDDPDERAPGHFPLLLRQGPRAVGAIRVDDLDGERAAFRLVAVAPDAQGRGHGRVLMREAEDFARHLGCRLAVVYATPEAAGFYAALGYAEDPFDEDYFGGIVMMAKPLHYAGHAP